MHVRKVYISTAVSGIPCKRRTLRERGRTACVVVSVQSRTIEIEVQNDCIKNSIRLPFVLLLARLY